MTDRIAVQGLGLWMAGYADVAGWTSGTADEAVVKPVGHGLSRTNKRRAGTMARAIADAATEAMREANADASTIATVVGSSLGEASTMLGLLDQMWRGEVAMSPAAFTVSVHNAASGLLSISSENRGFTTSIAADEDTPAAALLEAIGLVATRGEAAVVVCADEEAPRSLVRDTPPWDMLAAAVVLAPADATPCRAHLRILTEGEASLEPAAVDDRLVSSPQVGLVDLVDAVLRGVDGTVALDRGRGRGYLAELDFGTAP